MAYTVEWSRNASDDFEEIFEYLKDNWSYKIAHEFTVELLIKVELIAVSPQLGTSSEKDTSIRRMLITKHNYLYYKVYTDRIVLLDFIDTRQDPTKNPF